MAVRGERPAGALSLPSARAPAPGPGTASSSLALKWYRPGFTGNFSDNTHSWEVGRTDGGIVVRTLFGRPDSAAPPQLDSYDIAYLAGGPQRVAETVLIALRDRGVIAVTGPRVRALEAQPEHEGPERPEGSECPEGPDRPERPNLPEQPVERALVALCPRGKSVARVLAAVLHGPETAEIGRRLRSHGLLTRFRARPNRAGRRRLEVAREGGTLPAYVFDGLAAVPDRRLRRSVGEAAPLQSGFRRHLVRTARYIDVDSPYGSDHASDHGSGFGSDAGHASWGGGGGGGGGGD